MLGMNLMIEQIRSSLMSRDRDGKESVIEMDVSSGVSCT